MAKELSGGINCMRGLLLIFNILFVILGLILIGIGVYMKINSNFSSILDELTNIGKFDTQSLGFLAYVTIAGGVVTLFIALFGCMGTLWNNRCLLFIYATILLILMVIELAAFIMAFVYKGKLTEVYQTALYDVLKTGLDSNNTKILTAFDDLEKAMECCGVNNISDYTNANYTRSSEWCGKKPNYGCSQAIIDFLKKGLPAIGVTLGVVLATELLGLLSAIALAVALKNAPDDNYSSSPGQVLGNMVPGRRRNY